MAAHPKVFRPRVRRPDGGTGPITVRFHDVHTGERLWAATVADNAWLCFPPTFRRPVVTTVIQGAARVDTWPDGKVIP